MSSSTNGRPSRAASSGPTVLLPAPRRPSSATWRAPRVGAGRGTREQLRQRHLERARDLDQLEHRRIGAAGLDVGEEALADAGVDREFAAAPAAPFAQGSDRSAETGENGMVAQRG